MISLQDSRYTYLTRQKLAEALTAAGIPTSQAMLAELASYGGGPPFRRFGRRIIYSWSDVLVWLHDRLGPAVTSTSELDFIDE